MQGAEQTIFCSTFFLKGTFEAKKIKNGRIRDFF